MSYKDKLKSLERQKKDLKRVKTFIPSQLSPSKKKSVKYNLSERMGAILEKSKEIRKEQKESESKRKKFLSKLNKLARTKLSYKKGKADRATLTIPEYKAESAWDEPSRFFKSEMEATKKSLFFK